MVRQDAVPERANPTVLLRSLKIYKKTFSKIKHYKKRCRARPAMRGPKMRPSREGSNPTVPLRSLKIYKNAFSKKKHQKMELPTVRRILGPKTGPSQRGPINDPHTICDTFSLFSMTFLHKSSVSSADAAVASRPHTPHVKDYPGLGRP